MEPIQVVLDTCILIAALRSRQGASHRLLSLVGIDERFEANVSVGLVLEYEAVAKRQIGSIGLTEQEIDDVVDYLCAASNRRRVSYLWRTFLPDPGDDFLLELAVESDCDFIVTHNLRDFVGIERFGLRAIRPADFLRQIGEIP